MIGDKIKSLRIKKGLSAKQLAEETSLTPAYLSMLEKGKRTNPSLDIVQELANALDTTVDYLFSDDESTTNIKNIEISKKAEKDIKKALSDTLEQLENSQDGLMFDGEPIDDETRELLKMSLENSMRLAKQIAKVKYTPKKYKDKK
jgi:transcriptional regulator with XRE-family HTH domain